MSRIGDLERARDSALAERNRLGVDLAGARTRIAELQAEVDQWRATAECLQSGYRSQHAADSRELRSLCAARDAARKERDAALAEAERLRAEHDRASRLFDSIATTHAKLAAWAREALPEDLQGRFFAVLANGAPDWKTAPRNLAVDLLAMTAERDAALAEAERLRAEWQASERRAIEFGDILAQYIAAMRAAVLDEEDGMDWIKNTLAGPGHLPDGLGEHADAQAMFDAEVEQIELHRAKHPAPEPVVGPLRAQIRTLTAERDDALAELERAREVLSGVEWCELPHAYYGVAVRCPHCGGLRSDGHDPECPLSAALAAKGE